MTTTGDSNSFSSTPSTGQGFEGKSSGFTDMSGICADDFFAPLSESMAAGNTVNTPENGLPGSNSEQTEDVPDRTVTLDKGSAQSYTRHPNG